MGRYPGFPGAGRLVKMVMHQIRFDTKKGDIETFLCQIGVAPVQVYICRSGEMHPGKRTSCLITYRNLQEAEAAIELLNNVEVSELADVPLKCELATNGTRRQQQAATQQ